MAGFFRVRMFHCPGQSMPRATSMAELRMVSSPFAANAARLLLGWVSA
jgi:hypothetical protein